MADTNVAVSSLAEHAQSFWDSFRGVDLLTVIALFLGPVLAVIVAEIIRQRAETRARRIKTFKTLMATRTLNLLPSHIDAINFIELEFQTGSSADRNVIDKWRLYRAHLDAVTDLNSATANNWEIERKKRLYDLLFEMSVALGLSHERSAIEKGVYYPRIMGDVVQQESDTRKYWLEILKGERQIPMKAEVYTTQPAKQPVAVTGDDKNVDKPTVPADNQK